MNFLQRTPFFRLLLPLVIGIILYRYFDLFPWSQMSMLILSVLIFAVSFVLQRSILQFKFRWLYGSGIFLFLVLIGYSISNQNATKSNFDNIEIPGIFSVELTESPIEKENSFLCRVKTLQYFEKDKSTNSVGRALVYIQKDSLSQKLKSGDQLLIETTFNKPDGVINPAGFNYKEYLKRQGIAATTYISSYKWTKIGTNNEFSAFRLAEEYQKKLLDIYKHFGIEGDEFAVLAALTLGSKDASHPELRQNYTTSGGMHILAVSGLHVGIIYMVLSLLLSFLEKNKHTKILKVILIILSLWIYAFITGLPPSVVRATIMFSMIALGNGLNHKSEIYNTIFASAFLMLLFNPDFLFDVGFQLSYCAVLSIVYFQPKISKGFYFKNKLLKWSWDLTAVSLAAQIGTAPLTLFYFHQFANYFVITNFVAIPFATIILYTAILLIIVSPIAFVSTAVAFVLKWILRILNTSIEFIHDMPFSVTFTTINAIQVLLFFGIVILIAYYFYSKKYFAIFSAFSLLLFFLIINLTINYKTLNSTQFIVYSDCQNTHIDFIEGKNHAVLTTDSVAINKVAQNYWLKNKLNYKKEVLSACLLSNGFIGFQGKRFCILLDESLKGKTSENPIDVDYLIIANHVKPHFDKLLESIHPQKVVVDKSISKWYADNIEQTCVEKGIRYYSVAQKGAFILNLKD